MSKHYPSVELLVQCNEKDHKKCRFFVPRVKAYGHGCGTCEYYHWYSGSANALYGEGTCSNNEVLEYALNRLGSRKSGT